MSLPALRRQAMASALACALPLLAAAASPVGDALQRPALQIQAPQRAVLLSAALAGERIVAVGERGLIATSDDGGRQWRQAPSPVSVTLTMLRFADARHGVAIGHGGTVLVSTDAGASWSLRLDGRRIAQLAMDAAKDPAAPPEARRDAERLLADGPDKPLLDLLLWDARRMLVVGAYGLALHSADGGQSWTPWMARLPNPRGLHWYVARRAGDSLVLAGEQGLLVRSDDGGASFRPLASPYKGSWFTGELAADGSLLLAGLRGNVWRSADGGLGREPWQALASPQPASITSSLRLADGRLLLANQAGQVLALHGESLAPLNPAPIPMPAALLALRGGRLLSFGMAGVVPVSDRPNAQGARP